MHSHRVAVDPRAVMPIPRLGKPLSLLMDGLSVLLIFGALVAPCLQGSRGFRCGRFTPDIAIQFRFALFAVLIPLVAFPALATVLPDSMFGAI